MNKYMPEGALISTLKNHEYISSLEGLESAKERGVILEAEVILCDHNFNLHVDLSPKIRAIIPRDEVQFVKEGEEIKDIAVLTRVGKAVCFKVKGFTKSAGGETTVVLSRRLAQMECMNNYISTLVPGDIIPTKITHLESFGAFVLDVTIGHVVDVVVSQNDTLFISAYLKPLDELGVEIIAGAHKVVCLPVKVHGLSQILLLVILRGCLYPVLVVSDG